METSYQLVPITKLKISPLNPRHHSNEKSMNELIESIRKVGILTPLLVRPHDGGFEIAAGHRRLAAAKKVGLTSVPANVREMADNEFLEVLTIENLQREDIHPLDEAMGYRMLMEKANYDVASIAAKLGKSESYVYQRLKLSELIPEAQKKFLEDKITAGHAILIARLQPNEQKEALKEIEEETYGGDEIMSVRDLANFIERQIHLDLNSASFSKKDPDLVPEAGPCITCPKRTGFIPALFPDIKKKDTCTDPGCFEKKNQAFIDSWMQKKSQDSDIPPLRLSGNSNYQRKKIPENPLEAIPANLYEQIKKDSCKSAREGIVTEGRNKGKIMTVCVDPDCKVHHPKHGDSSLTKYRAQQKVADEKRKLEVVVRVRVVDEIMKKISGDLSKEDLAFLAEQLFEELWSEYQKKILARHEIKPKKLQYGHDTQAPMDQYIGKCGKTDLFKLLIEMVLIRNIETRNWAARKKKDPLLAMAERYHVDPKKIEAQFRAQAKEKKAEKKRKKKKSPSVKQKEQRGKCNLEKSKDGICSHLLAFADNGETISSCPPRKCCRGCKKLEDCNSHCGPASELNKKPVIAPKSGVCRECGCTETTPCEGGCAWTDKTKTLCTACQMAKEHHWEKQNLVTVASTRKVPMHDIYKCKKCGATAKRFGVGPIRRDEKFAKLEECPGPKKKVQTSAKKE